MAAVVVASTFSQWMPLAGIAGITMWVASSSRKAGTAPVRQLTPEQEIDKKHRKEMEFNGISQSAFQAMHNKQVTMGGNVTGDLFLDNVGGGWNPNPDVDVLSKLRHNSARVASYDRHQAYYILSESETGVVRPPTNMPIVASLSKEIHHPNDMSRRSELEAHKLVPSNASDLQIRKAKAERDKADRSDQALRRHYDVAMFNRAPGQSFRYE